MNEKYERLTVTASDGSVGIRRGYSKDDWKVKQNERKADNGFRG